MAQINRTKGIRDSITWVNNGIPAWRCPNNNTQMHWFHRRWFCPIFSPWLPKIHTRYPALSKWQNGWCYQGDGGLYGPCTLHSPLGFCNNVFYRNAGRCFFLTASVVWDKNWQQSWSNFRVRQRLLSINSSSVNVLRSDVWKQNSQSGSGAPTRLIAAHIQWVPEHMLWAVNAMMSAHRMAILCLSLQTSRQYLKVFMILYVTASK